MIVAVDARQAYRKAPRGIGKSLILLYRRLMALRPTWRFLMFHQVPFAPDPFAGLPNVEARRIDIPGGDRFNLWEQVRLPLAARLSRADVLHCPANTGPRFPLVPMVLTVHDLIPIELSPEASANRRWLKRVAAAARRAAVVITVSEYSKRQVIRYIGVPEDRVAVNYQSVDVEGREVPPLIECERVAVQYGVEAYVLSFGAEDTRKNTVRLLQAWARLPAELRQGLRLLVIGIQDDVRESFRLIASSLGIGEECRFHGFVPDSDLHALFAGARVFAYPSLAEGFGLPVLEAYWCGTPVLTSDRTSLPEIAGDAAVLINPYDVQAIARGLERLLTDDALRADLVAKGCIRRQYFSWDRIAERLASVLEGRI